MASSAAPNRHFVIVRRSIRALLADRSGVAAVEFGFVAVVFFMTLFGILELSRLIAARNALVEAVNVAGRYAIVNGGASSAPASVGQIRGVLITAAPLLNTSQIVATVSYVPDNMPGSRVTVQATYPWRPIITLVPLPAITLVAQSVLTIQN